jgi:hypothetical protein
VAVVKYTFTHVKYIEQHIQTIHVHRITPNLEECEPCPVFASYTLAFALQLRKKHGKNLQGSRRVPTGTMKTEYMEKNIYNNENT